MPRARRQFSSSFFYHVTARCNNRERFPKPLDFCWDVFGEQLAKVSEKYNAQVIAFVLMLNHFHMLISTPDANLDRAMNYLMRETSKRIGLASGRINHIYGGRHKASLLMEDAYVYHAYKYVYLNPVAAGIVGRAENYRYSTLRNIAEQRRPAFPIYDHLVERRAPIPKPIVRRLEWLNRNYEIKERRLIQQALRRPIFRFSREDRNQSIARELCLAGLA